MRTSEDKACCERVLKTALFTRRLRSRAASDKVDSSELTLFDDALCTNERAGAESTTVLSPTTSDMRMKGKVESTRSSHNGAVDAASTTVATAGRSREHLSVSGR